jgi:hypothetical protein
MSPLGGPEALWHRDMKTQQTWSSVGLPGRGGLRLVPQISEPFGDLQRCLQKENHKLQVISV